jgi:hypothetical protein
MDSMDSMDSIDSMDSMNYFFGKIFIRLFFIILS